MSAPASRLLILGLDSADAELIERWSDEGHLPHLARLRAEGSWNRIGTTAEVMHVSGWPSMYTGATPGAHGLYHAYQVRAGEQAVHRTRARECALPPFWKHLDDAGRACLVVDAFLGSPVPGFRGVEVLEYGTWTWFDEPRSNPPALWKEIQRRFGPYPAPEHTNVLTQPDPARFRDQLTAGARVKGELVAWLLRERPWDVCFAMLGETHPAGHYLWHVGDASYPTYPGPGALGNALRDVYAAVDAAIGTVLAAVDERTTVLVTSGDGMGPNHAGTQLVPELLHRMGLYFGPDVGRTPDTGTRAGAPATKRGAARVLRDLVPFGLRRTISRCMPAALQHRLSMKWANADIDWTRTRAFVLPNANEAYLRVNQAGREPRGLLRAEEETRELLELLTREGQGLRTDAPALRAVYDTDRVFPGPLRPDLPDLVWAWDPAARIQDTLHAPSAGTLRGATPWGSAPFYSGNHRPNAFLLARAPHLAAGTRLSGAHVLDLAPTVLAHQSVPRAAHHAGRVLAALVA